MSYIVVQVATEEKDGNAMTDTIKILCEFSEGGAEDMKKLGRESGIPKPSDVILESLEMMSRVVAEITAGRRIASISTENDRIVASIDNENRIVNVLYSKKIMEERAAKYVA